MKCYVNNVMHDAFEHCDFNDCAEQELTPELVLKLELAAYDNDEHGLGCGVTARDGKLILFPMWESE